jgi:hypothetical protein
MEKCPGCDRLTAHEVTLYCPECEQIFRILWAYTGRVAGRSSTPGPWFPYAEEMIEAIREIRSYVKEKA